MSEVLKAARDHVGHLVAAAEAELVNHKSVLATIEAELERIPSLDDVRAVLDRVAARLAQFPLNPR